MEKFKRKVQETNKEGLKTENKKTYGISKVAQSNFIISDQKFSTEAQKTNESSPSLSIEKKQDLVKRAEGCSTRATMKLLSEADPSLSVSKEQARFLGNGKVEIKLVIDESSYKNLEELKSLLSHKNPILSHGELLSILLEEALEKHDPRRKKIRKTIKKEAVTSAQKLKAQQVNRLTATSPQKWEYRGNTKQIHRTIPSYIRKHIWERDEGQCTYVHPETKRKCSSRYLLQIDHIKPFSLGGKSEVGNLRLLCAGHNQLRSEKTFGKRINYTPPV